MNKKTVRNSFLLFLAALIWGVAFVSQVKGMESMGPLTFNAVRSFLGGAVLLPVIFFMRSRETEKKPVNFRILLPGGIFCGMALATAGLLQQYGMLYTSIGKCGFITALYIIFTPIFGIFIKRKTSAVVWIGALIALVGMYLLCMNGDASVNKGDVLVLLCAMVFAVHILVIDHFTALADGVMLSCIQHFVVSGISGIGAFLFETPSWEQIMAGGTEILYAGILSSGVAYTLQIVGQKDMNPTAAALILSLESVISSVAGFLAYKIGFLASDQTMTVRQIFGCAVVFCAVIFVQIPLDIPARRAYNDSKHGDEKE